MSEHRCKKCGWVSSDNHYCHRCGGNMEAIPMTKQEAFNIVWHHFITNNSRSGFENGLCRLRTSDGRRCALGLFVPDDAYRPEWDGNFTGFDVAKLVADMTRIDVDFCGQLQLAHDAAVDGVAYARHGGFTGAIRHNLEQLALRNNLTIPQSA